MHISVRALIHRYSLYGLLSCGVAYLGISLLVDVPSKVSPLELHCIVHYDPSIAPDERSVLLTSPSPIDLLSWDLGVISPGSSPEEIERIVLPRLSGWFHRPGVSAVLLQGVRPHARHRLVNWIREEGGCWAYAPVWSIPTWITWMHTLGVDVYSSILGPSRLKRFDLEEKGLWFAIKGLAPEQIGRVERWSLPPQPGRWPRRLFYPHPAALSVELWPESPTPQQVIQLSLPDAMDKHQAGALGLQALQRDPLQAKLTRNWLLMGDLRAAPTLEPPHPEAGYRFKRFSIVELFQAYPSVFPIDADPKVWGGWRGPETQIPEIIDHAFASTGQLKSVQMKKRSECWVGHSEQRLPLMATWIPDSISE